MKKFKYVAIGDSISQGFNSMIGAGTCGYKNKKDYLKGFSFTDFFVSLLEKYCYESKNDYKKDFFDNLEYHNISLSVARAIDFINLIDKKKSEEFITLVKVNKYIEEMSNISIQKNLWKIDDSMSDAENLQIMRDKYIETIKDADLITITIGGNEFQSSIPIELIRTILFEPNLYKQLKLKEELYTKIRILTEEIKQNYITFIQKIQFFAPNAKIILLNYTLPFLQIFHNYQLKLLKSNPKVFTNFLTGLSELGTDIIQNVANVTNVFFCDIYNQKF
ncbi:UNVERIFIED_CONTAM: hypothetical protein O8I53_05910 [Campylobacter lari]